MVRRAATRETVHSVPVATAELGVVWNLCYNSGSAAKSFEALLVLVVRPKRVDETQLQAQSSQNHSPSKFLSS